MVFISHKYIYMIHIKRTSHDQPINRTVTQPPLCRTRKCALGRPYPGRGAGQGVESLTQRVRRPLDRRVRLDGPRQ